MYVSNESDEMVYFDNLQVTQNHARIIEENHYYAYGLKIAAISSKKMPDLAEGHITNKDLYNDKELIDDADLNWYDYGFRSYDPQIGRFVQLDPLSDYYPDLNPYHYAGLDPIDKVDVAGLGIGDVITIGEVFLKSTAKHVAKSAGSLTSTVLRISGSLTVNVTNAIVQTVVTNNTSQVGGSGPGPDPLRMAMITGQGTSDALAHASSLSTSEWFNSAEKRLNRYGDSYEQSAYLKGRIGGDGIALGMSAAQIDAGIGAAGAGLATGPGALLLTTGGVLVAAHGAGQAYFASRDMAWAIKKLYQLNMSATGASDAGLSSSNQPKYKKPKSGVSGKQGAKDVPDWARGQKPYENENGKTFARRLLEKKYGKGNFKTGPGSEYNKLQKWGDRSFE